MDPPNLGSLLLTEPSLLNQNFVEACYDQNVMWVNDEIENIMENGENITPSIEEFMRNLDTQ